MTILWTELALHDLDSLEAYVSQENPTAVIALVLSVIDSVEHLAVHPYMGRAGRMLNSREWVVSNTPYVVVYGVSQATLTVFRVLHEAQQWPECD